MVYIISDTHFWHENIHKYCSRHSYNIDEYQNGLIYELQKVLTPQDKLLHLGDLMCGHRKSKIGTRHLLDKLPCEKHFIIGNHDYHLSKADLYDLGFKSVQDYILIEDTLYCHYPFDKKFYKSNFFNNTSQEYLWDLFFNNPDIKKIYHGHIHNNRILRDDKITRINCCVDAYAKGYNIIIPDKEDNQKLGDYLNGKVNR